MALSFLRFGGRVTSRSFKNGIPPGAASLDQVHGRCAHVASRPIPFHERLWHQQLLRSELRLYSKLVPGKQEKEHNNQSDSESDSDDESFRKRDESVFWRCKIRTFHGILDINKDGVISYEDLTVFVNRFVELGHLCPQSQKEFQNLFQSMWEERWGSMDAYNMITTELLLEDMHHVLNDKNLRKKVHSFLPYLFKALDKDKSGQISVEEYKLFFRCLGLTDEAAVVAFSAIDENNDGQLSMKEFVRLGRNFFITEDPKKASRMFWGPLIHDHN